MENPSTPDSIEVFTAQNTPFFIETCLESYLPKDMISIISNSCGIPIYKNDSMCEFISVGAKKTPSSKGGDELAIFPTFFVVICF